MATKLSVLMQRRKWLSRCPLRSLANVVFARGKGRGGGMQVAARTRPRHQISGPALPRRRRCRCCCRCALHRARVGTLADFFCVVSAGKGSTARGARQLATGGLVPTGTGASCTDVRDGSYQSDASSAPVCDGAGLQAAAAVNRGRRVAGARANTGLLVMGACQSCVKYGIPFCSMR